MCCPFPFHLKPELLNSIPAHSNGHPTPSVFLMPSIALSRMPENMKQEVLCTKVGLGNNWKDCCDSFPSQVPRLTLKSYNWCPLGIAFSLWSSRKRPNIWKCLMHFSVGKHSFPLALTPGPLASPSSLSSFLIFLSLLNKNTFHLPFISEALCSFQTASLHMMSSQQETSKACIGF